MVIKKSKINKNNGQPPTRTFDRGSKDDEMVVDGFAVLVQVQAGGVGHKVANLEALICTRGRGRRKNERDESRG